MRQNVIIETVPEDLVHKLTKEKTGDSMQVGLNIKIKRIGRGYTQEEGIHRKRLQMPSVSPVLHTQDTSQTRDCRTYTNYVHWQIILMYHWTTWWEETGNRKKITKDVTSRSNHSRNAYKVRGGNKIKAEGQDIQ